jgi:hypothetical protein
VDNVIREALEEAKRRAEGVHGYSAIDKINEVIALLTAEPEPCNSCKFYEGCEHTFEHKPSLKDDSIGQAIDALRVNALRFGNKELEAIADDAHKELIALRESRP